MSDLLGFIFDVKHFALHDGPGIRTTVFLKGCPLRCKWCHSPESQNFGTEIIYNEELCIACGSCVYTCSTGAHIKPGEINKNLCTLCLKCVDECFSGALEAVGYRTTVTDLMREIEKDRLLYETSNGGVTISGGEPMTQPEFLTHLLRTLKQNGYHTALDTCGYVSWTVLARIASDVNLFLYDLKHMDTHIHRQLTGHGNRLILSNLKKLDKIGSTLRVRVPLIPGINDSENNLVTMSNFLWKIKNLECVDLLPYHKMGIPKYTALGREYSLNNINTYETKRLIEIRNIFAGHGLQVKLEGV